MSKEKTSTPDKGFNILETSFGEGMDMVFTDESFINEAPIVPEEKEEVEVITPTKEVTTEVVDTKPLEETITPASKPIETSTEEKESSLVHFASWLGDKGLVDFDAETFEDSEDGLKNLMSSTVEREVENYKKSLPEEVHRLVEFVEAGGNPKQFLDTYYSQATWSDFKLEDENDSKAVLKEYLKAQGEDEEDINETIDTYEVSGILEKKAKVALTKLQTLEKNYQEEVFESQKKFDAEQKVLAKKQYEEFKDKLYAKEDIQGFKLTPKLKDNLWDFIMKPDKQGKTGLQKHNETNENAQFMYAYLAMNDWDLTKLEKQVKNKVNSELASKLSNFKDGRSKLKSGQSDGFGQERSSGNFSAFKQALNNGLL